MIRMIGKNGPENRSAHHGLGGPAGRVAGTEVCARIQIKVCKASPLCELPVDSCQLPARHWQLATVLSRPQPAPRVLTPELVECSIADRPADVRHQPLVEPDIMHGEQNRSKHLAR